MILWINHNDCSQWQQRLLQRKKSECKGLPLGKSPNLGIYHHVAMGTWIYYTLETRKGYLQNPIEDGNNSRGNSVLKKALAPMLSGESKRVVNIWD